MANFADYLGDTNDAAMYSSYASNLKANFNVDFWNSTDEMWADSIDGTTQYMLGYAIIPSTPQEIEIADPDKAVIVIDKKAAEDRYNVYTGGIIMIGAYNYGRYEQGWTRLKWYAKAPMENGTLGGFEDTPLIQTPAIYIQGVMEGLCGIRPDAARHKVEVFPQAPAELDDFSLDNFYVGQHKLDLSWTREPGGDQEITILHESGPVAIDVTIRVKSEPGQVIKLNGAIITPSEETVRGIVTKPVNVSLTAGQQAVVRVE